MLESTNRHDAGAIRETRETTGVDSHHSELERNKEKLDQYIALLEKTLGNGIRVVGILEIGSFANGEGMALSDIDTRVYVEAPDAYVWNIAGHASSEALMNDEKIAAFIATHDRKDMRHFSWTECNEPMWKKIKEELGISIEFGLVDKRYAAYELDHLEASPSNEHSFLMQSNIVYDPDQFLTKQKARLEGKTIPSMAEFYKKRFLDGLPAEIYRYVDVTEKDLPDIQERQKIQWIKWAVRAVREAVATKTYITTGKIIHEKEDVLVFYHTHVPEHYDLVAMLYTWKTDPQMRSEILAACIADPKAMSERFRSLMPKLEKAVEAVKNISI